MPTRSRTSLVTALLLCGALATACSAGSSPDSAATSGSGAQGGSSGEGGSSGTGTDQGGGLAQVSVSVGNGSGGEEQGALVVAPQDPALDVELGVPGQTVQFSATRGDSPVNGVAWFLSTPEAGTISADGLFTSNGQAGGEITVGARLDDETATTTLTLNLHALENPGGVSQTDQDLLTAPGGQADPAWNIWYPYNGTVFPRGVPAPAWQSATSALTPTTYYLRIEGANVVYEGFLAPEGGAPRARPSRAAWDAIGTATDGADMTVTMAKLVGGVKYGPITQTIRIARGKLKGTIYYNTYDSPLAGDAAIMRIRGDLTTPEVLLGGCRVCHSVSADGSTIAASNEQFVNGGTFDVLANPDTPPNVWVSPEEEAAFAGLYPQGGEVFVQQGRPTDSWFGNAGNTPGSEGMATSMLRYRDGTPIPNSGIEGYYAQTPMFSHDGTRLAFYDRPQGGGSGVLAVMDFDIATKTFSNYIVIGTPTPGMHLSWPAFTPDGKWVLYQEGDAGDLATWNQNHGSLRAVNLETNEVSQLPALNGDAYVPQGERDRNLHFEPTLLPLASGGYYWVMYTSRRTHGNMLTSGRESTKRLWVSAFSLSPEPGQDPSFPGFFVEGQENAGNSRGFWALDPCRQDGEGCESGDQCCNGFCNPSAADPNVFVCGQPDGSCSDEFESCETAADCCDPEMDCINGRCAQDDPPPPQ